jgi:hypothetical protein
MPCTRHLDPPKLGASSPEAPTGATFRARYRPAGAIFDALPGLTESYFSFSGWHWNRARRPRPGRSRRHRPAEPLPKPGPAAAAAKRTALAGGAADVRAPAHGHAARCAAGVGPGVPGNAMGPASAGPIDIEAKGGGDDLDACRPHSRTGGRCKRPAAQHAELACWRSSRHRTLAPMFAGGGLEDLRGSGSRPETSQTPGGRAVRSGSCGSRRARRLVLRSGDRQRLLACRVYAP